MNIKILNDEPNTYKDRFIDLQKYCFQRCKRDKLTSLWDSLNQETGNAFGLLDGETLTSSLIVHNYNISFYGQLVPMGGIGGVTTAATYRSKGVCSKLLKHAIESMYHQGVVFSALAPFMYEFYEKFGYKWCYTQSIYKMKMEHLKNFKSKGTIIPIDTSNSHALYNLYEKLILTYNGMCSRTSTMWDQKLASDTYAILFEATDGAPTGYMLYTIDSDNLCFEVKEIMYQSCDALKSFLHFIYSHNAQVNEVKIVCFPDTNLLDILPNPRCDYHIQSSLMGRIINMQEALSYYPFKSSGSFVLKVSDPICPWNDGSFRVSITNASGAVTQKVDELSDFEIDIKELSQLILGFRTFEDLLKIESINLINPDFAYSNYFNAQSHPIGLYDSF